MLPGERSGRKKKNPERESSLEATIPFCEVSHTSFPLSLSFLNSQPSLSFLHISSFHRIQPSRLSVAMTGRRGEKTQQIPYEISGGIIAFAERAMWRLGDESLTNKEK